MGGSALLIYGTISDDLLRPRPGRRSLLDRLLGRVRTEVPTWQAFGRDRRLIDLPADGLASFGVAFVDHVATRFKPPWTATSAVIDYLKIGVTSVYVRGEATGTNPAEWYVQLTFGGCAGMAEVSSELAAHWADRWYRAEQANLVTKFLRKYGFEPNGRLEPVPASAVFVPFGIAGYALYNSTARPKEQDDEEYFESRYFEIDNSATETIPENEKRQLFEKLDEELPPLLPKASCCCQWCAPDFDAAAIDRLVPFR